MFIQYDASFDGLLSAVAWCFRRGLKPEGFLSESDGPTLLEVCAIPREQNIRRLFRRHLASRLGPESGSAVLDSAYRAYLSEDGGIADQIGVYLERALQLGCDPSGRLYEPPVAAVAGAARRVSAQAHKYLGLLRFHNVGPAFSVADFRPDYHVLPIILPHFTDRLADQNFAIRDLRRRIAALHLSDGRVSLHILAESGFPPDEGEMPLAGPFPGQAELAAAASERTAAEPDFSALWRLYLKRLSIPERRNPALQRANMPKKYWKYLTEDPSEY